MGGVFIDDRELQDARPDWLILLCVKERLAIRRCIFFVMFIR